LRCAGSLQSFGETNRVPGHAHVGAFAIKHEENQAFIFLARFLLFSPPPTQNFFTTVLKIAIASSQPIAG